MNHNGEKKGKKQNNNKQKTERKKERKVTPSPQKRREKWSKRSACNWGSKKKKKKLYRSYNSLLTAEAIVGGVCPCSDCGAGSDATLTLTWRCPCRRTLHSPWRWCCPCRGTLTPTLTLRKLQTGSAGQQFPCRRVFNARRSGALAPRRFLSCWIVTSRQLHTDTSGPLADWTLSPPPIPTAVPPPPVTGPRFLLSPWQHHALCLCQCGWQCGNTTLSACVNVGDNVATPRCLLVSMWVTMWQHHTDKWNSDRH